MVLGWRGRNDRKMFQCEIKFQFYLGRNRYPKRDEEVRLVQRKTLGSVEISVLLSAFASVVAVVAMGILVHGIMWANVGAHEASVAPAQAKPIPAPRVRISSRTLVA